MDTPVDYLVPAPHTSSPRASPESRQAPVTAHDMRISTAVDQIQPAAAKACQLPKLKIASSKKAKKPAVRPGSAQGPAVLCSGTAALPLAAGPAAGCANPGTGPQ
ncbi:hypothetical protein CFAM422_005403 [Trichoderma lentiforme]|uniref:Uncharacterized protein n=1 Tax=Trichoderma lentiforme TaxID=1567552 RepID=A0A9P4XHK8_9HYPO|nr:hypothetical protein CFAM422_005403 [Trichoderma lentiforme]